MCTYNECTHYIYMYMYIHVHVQSVHMCNMCCIPYLSPLQFQRRQHQVVVDGATVYLEIVSPECKCVHTSLLVFGLVLCRASFGVSLSAVSC